jgi:hypothetical protein
MATIEERVSTLTDQQALSIVDFLAGEFASSDMPEGTKAQAQALGALLSREGHDLDLSRVAQSSTTPAATAARQVLLMMAQVPQMKASVDQWLDNPPVQETAAVPLLLAAPVVFTGCIALLQVVGHVKFKLDSKKQWGFHYDPGQPTIFDQTLKDMVRTLARLMRVMTAGS